LSLDLAFDDAQQAIHDAVAHFCAAGGRSAEADFSPARWRELGALGVLALTTPEGEGGAAELVAALEALGAAGFPGPLAASFLAVSVLTAAERARIGDGEAIVSVGAPPLMPWAPHASLFLIAERDALWHATPRGPVEPVATLGGEPWGRLQLERGAALGSAPQAFALFDLSQAALLAAHGQSLLDAACDHARTRVQFGRTIGEFQAVAHPLADASMRLAGARTLARAAACAFDEARGATPTRTLAAAARTSARGAALASAHVAHQTFGALGITLEGPAFRWSRRIRQLASQPPREGAGGGDDALLAAVGG